MPPAGRPPVTPDPRGVTPNTSGSVRSGSDGEAELLLATVGGRIDRLTQLACLRQGVAPDTLLPDPGTPASPPASPPSRRRRAPTGGPGGRPIGDDRRRAKLGLVAAERRVLRNTLARGRGRKLGRELLFIVAEEQGIAPHEVTEHDVSDDTPPEERDSAEEVSRSHGSIAVEALARRAARAEVRFAAGRQRGRLRDMMDASRGAEDCALLSGDAERFRMREMRQVAKERELEVSRAELDVAMQQRDAAIRRKAERRERRRREAAEKQRDRVARSAAARRNVEDAEARRAAEFAERDRARAALDARRAVETGEERRQRAEAARAREEEHHARFNIVTDARAQREELQRDELGTRHDLHEERRQHCKLEQARRFETQRLGRLHREAGMEETRERMRSDEAEWRACVLDKDVAAESRVVSRVRAVQRDVVRRRRERIEAARRAESIRLRGDVYHQGQVQQLLVARVAREEQLEHHRETKEVLRQERGERLQQRRIAAQDNKVRLEARKAFSTALRLAKVRGDDAHKDEIDRRRKADQLRHEREVCRVREQKRAVKAEIEALRRAPAARMAELLPAAPGAEPAPRVTSASPVMSTRPPTGQSGPAPPAPGAAVRRGKPAPRPKRDPPAPPPPELPATTGEPYPRDPGVMSAPLQELCSALDRSAPDAAGSDAGTASSDGGAGRKPWHQKGMSVWDPSRVYGAYCATQKRRPIHSAPPRGRPVASDRRIAGGDANELLGGSYSGCQASARSQLL